MILSELFPVRFARLLVIAFSGLLPGVTSGAAAVVDTGQALCYDASLEIACPQPGETFHGQDAQYDGTQPSFASSADGLTVHDNVTGLTWDQSPDTDGDGDVDSDDKLTWLECQGYPATLNAQNYGGFSDWRLPTIKELYSLIDFSGVDPSGYQGGTSGLVPFIDTDYFAFAYGDESAGERIIDAQYWSSTEYVGTTMGGDATVFGVNFADGRIKGYPRDTGPFGQPFTEFVRCVRGNTDYGVNDFVDNGDGTVTDTATGLMWMQDDSGVGYNWADALAYAENLTVAQYDDWRLPNAKELQGIVDYTRSPSTTGSAAIDPVFNATSIVDEAGETNYAFYWTGTTHANWTDGPGSFAVYVAFGEALGYMGPPGIGQWIDVHGAGAQRSDPKSGDPADWPYGNGPQGDAVRIYNFVRCVRDASPTSSVGDESLGVRTGLGLRNFPNPFNPDTELVFSVPNHGAVTLAVYDPMGRHVRTLLQEHVVAGQHRVRWDGVGTDGHVVPSGVYFARLTGAAGASVVKMLLVR